MVITERKLNELRMTHIANHDALTGLPNRNLLEDRFKSVLANCRRDKTMTAVMFVDLDKFKPINDTYGHQVGDLLLIEVTKRMRQGVREVDTVSRHGGDEFIVLMSSIGTASDAEKLACKLLKSVCQPYLIEGNTLAVSVSIGIAVFPDDGADMEILLQHSDLAMYHAKKQSGNNCQRYTDSMFKE
jgi:diguanylate cyclase (GGDEF)-like protein